MGQAVSDPEVIQQLLAKSKGKEVTDPEILKKLMQKAGEAPLPEGPAENFTSGMAKGVKAIASGTASGLGLLGDLQAVANPYLGPLGKSGTIFPRSGEFNQLFGSLGRAAQAGLESLAPGINLDTRPKNKLEEYEMNALRGAASAAPIAALTGGLGGLLASGAGGGVGAQAGNDLFEGNPSAQPWAEFGGGLLGGLTGQSLLRAGARAFHGPPVEQVARGLGDATTLQEAGTHLQEQARIWRNQIMPAQMAQAWAPIDNFMGGVQAVGVQNYQGRLNALTRQVGGMLGTSSARLSPSLIQNLNDMLWQEWVRGQRFPSWQELKDFRTKLGDALDTPELVESGGSANLRSLYGALTDDMRAAVLSQPNGQNMVRELENANRTSKALFDFAEGPLSKVITDRRVAGAGADPRIRPEDAAARLLSAGRKGASDIAALRGAIPEAVDQLAAASLRLEPGQAGARAWPRLSPEAKEALVADPQARRILDSELPLTPPTTMTQALSTGLRSTPAGAVLGLLSHNILNTSPESALIASMLPWGVGGAAVATLTPPALNALGRFVGNPGLFRGPIAGAVAGSNDLLAPQAPLPQVSPDGGLGGSGIPPGL